MMILIKYLPFISCLLCAWHYVKSPATLSHSVVRTDIGVLPQIKAEIKGGD